MEKAAELYKLGVAPLILPSGQFNPKIPEYNSEWEFLKTVGVKLGVPEEKILKEDKARHTFENAEFPLKVIKDNWFLDDGKIKIVMGEVVKIGKYFETIIKEFHVDSDSI